MQTIKLNINPEKGEKLPVLFVSQYDNGRLFGIELVEGEEAYNVPSGYSVQLNVRKTDSKLVTKSPDSIVDNILTFSTTKQMTACSGENIASITLKDTNDIVITTLYFLISVQRDVLAGGLDSASEIHDLEEQIAAIVPEVIGDDYYNKTETDALLADKADVSDLPDMSQYYNKTQTDALLADKADVSDLPDMSQYYNKTQTDALLADKADVSDLPDMSQYYTKQQVDNIIDDIFPTFTASGSVASFTTALNKHLVSVTHEAGATTITRCGKNFCNPSSFTRSIINYPDGTTQPALSWLTSDYIPVNGGSITISGYADGPKKNFCVRFVQYDANKNTVLVNANIDISGASSWEHTITLQATTKYIRVTVGFDNETTTIEDYFSTNRLQIENSVSASDYVEYNGQTVPVAQATTLTTLSGVNNVFADSGDVTVQYKYMSM